MRIDQAGAAGRPAACRARSPLFAVLVALALALHAGFLAYLIAYAIHAPQDLLQDYVSARQLLEGRPLYPDLAPFRAGFARPPGGFGDVESIDVNLHPPISVLLVLPLAVLPYPLASLIWELGGLLAYAATWWLLLDGLDLRPRAARGWLVVTAAALLHPALLPSVLYVTLSPYISLLLVAAWACYRRGRGALAALLLALASTLKLYPALLIGIFLLRRDWRAAATAVLGVLGIVLVTLPILTPSAYRDYLAVLPKIGRWITLPGNWSLAGLFGRLFTAGPFTTPLADAPLVASLLTALAGVGVIGAPVLAALRAHAVRPAGRFDALYACGLLALLLVSPVAWAHYTVPTALAWCLAARAELLSGHWCSARGRLLLVIALGTVLFPFALALTHMLAGAAASSGQTRAGPLANLLIAPLNTYALLALLALNLRDLVQPPRAPRQRPGLVDALPVTS